jgi:siroheme synthase (precorrin-2 oxidase/ferrochelatase)
VAASKLNQSLDTFNLVQAEIKRHKIKPIHKFKRDWTPIVLVFLAFVNEALSRQLFDLTQQQTIVVMVALVINCLH